MNVSAESRVLTEYFDRLQTMIQGNMIAVSSKALSSHLLSSQEHSNCTHMMFTEDVKASNFMMAVKKKVQTDPSYFSILMTVLKQESSYGFMVDKIEKDLEKMRKNMPAQSHVTEDRTPIGNPENEDGIDFDAVDGTTMLDPDDAFEIAEAVNEVAVNFIPLGEALRLKHGDLAIIEKRFKDEPRRGLKDVINNWLDQNYNVVKHGVPTWKMLVKAVAHPSGGANCAVARRIAEEHPVPQPESN